MTPPSPRQPGFEVLDRLTVGIVIVSPAGVVEQANPAAGAVRGLTLEQVIGQPFATGPLWSEQGPRSPDIAGALSMAARGTPQTLDVEVSDRFGQPCHLRLDLAAIDGAGSPPFRVVAQTVDISAQMHIESALRESRREIANAQRLARVGNWNWSVDGGYITWSPELYRIFGLDARRRPPDWDDQDRLYTPESYDRLRAAVTASAQTGVPFLLELEFLHASGRRGWLLTQSAADLDPAGQVLRLYGTAQDITEQRRLHDVARRELAQAQSLASALEERANLEREIVQFLAHEIRQPLNNASAALQGAVRALIDRGDAMPEPAHRPLARAEAVLSHVIGALNNSLAAASLLVAGDTQAFTETDLDTLIGLVLHDIDTSQRARVQVDRLAGTRTVQVQSNLMRLALCNLLNNALDYSPPASIVTLRISDSDDPLAVLFDVVDSGAGIPPELLSRAFDKGVRGANAYSRAGSGLGLYIVQRVAALHGGGVSQLPSDPSPKDRRQSHTVRMTVPQGLAR